MITQEHIQTLEAKAHHAFSQQKELEVSDHPLLILSRQKKVTHEDLVRVTQLGDEAYQVLAKMDETTLTAVLYQYGVRLEELRKNTQRRLSFSEFVMQLGAADENHLPLATARLVESKTDTQAQLLLSAQDTWDLFTSRLFPLLSKAESQKLKDAHVVVVGASTGSVIATLLAQYGVGKITLIDFDTIEQSNLNRIAGATQQDVGVNKAVFAAQQLVWLQPDMEVTAYTQKLQRDELKALFSTAAVVVEMIDSLPAKIEIREVTKELEQEGKQGLMVWMATNVDTPQITLESSADPLFLSDTLSQAILEGMLNPKGPQDFIRGVIAICGRENLPDRQMVNLLLIAHGELSYLAQHGVSAAGAGWGLVYLIQRHICGAQIEQHQHVFSVDSMIQPETMERVDESYFIELQTTYPHIFAEFKTLPQAVETLLERLLA